MTHYHTVIFSSKGVLTIGFLTLLLLLTSCESESSDDVNQDKIFAMYSLDYSAEEDKSYAEAAFRFGNALGTALELENPAKIEFNGNMMQWVDLLAFYRKEIGGPLDSGTFVFTDGDLNEFTNSAVLAPSIALPNIDSIPSSSSYTLTWVGDPVAADEEITVTMDGLGESDYMLFKESAPGSTSIVLDKDDLQSIIGGEATIQIKRKVSYDLQQASSEGGMLSSTWKSEERTVRVY